MKYATIYTQSGLIGAEIKKETNKKGDVTFAYIGKFGAGSGHKANYMQELINQFLSKKGTSVVYA